VARPEVVKANRAPGAGKQRSCSKILAFGFVSGHDFSRALNGPIKVRALAPEDPVIHSVARPEVVKANRAPGAGKQRSCSEILVFSLYQGTTLVGP
jgi:hypothetical protein